MTATIDVSLKTKTIKKKRTSCHFKAFLWPEPSFLPSNIGGCFEMDDSTNRSPRKRRLVPWKQAELTQHGRGMAETHATFFTRQRRVDFT